MPEEIILSLNETSVKLLYILVGRLIKIWRS